MGSHMKLRQSTKTTLNHHFYTMHFHLETDLSFYVCFSMFIIHVVLYNWNSILYTHYIYIYYTYEYILSVTSWHKPTDDILNYLKLILRLTQIVPIQIHDGTITWDSLRWATCLNTTCLEGDLKHHVILNEVAGGQAVGLRLCERNVAWPVGQVLGRVCVSKPLHMAPSAVRHQWSK